MLKEKKEKLLYNWRIWILAIALLVSLWQIGPRFGKFGGVETNLDFGFEISGGTRVILAPKEATTPEVLEEAVTSLRSRMNIYGLKDISVQSASDLDGNDYVIVKASGMSKDEVESLLSKQGNFEMRIKNQTVITGNEISVRADSQSAGIRSVKGAYMYTIPLYITSYAAQKDFADATDNLTVSLDGDYLSSQLEFYLDGELVQSLNIASDLKGKIIDSPVVTGTRATREEAQKEYEVTQAILKSGSLPIKLDTISIDTVSPRLGRAFLEQVAVALMGVFVITALIVWLYYKDTVIVSLMSASIIFDALLVLGISAMSNSQMDLSSIAGLIVGLGISVDQQLVITDQLLKGELEHEEKVSLKKKIKTVGSILFASLGTSITAMAPLILAPMFSPALVSLRGFAIMSLLTEMSAYFVTRPAYLVALEAEFR